MKSLLRLFNGYMHQNYHSKALEGIAPVVFHAKKLSPIAKPGLYLRHFGGRTCKITIAAYVNDLYMIPRGDRDCQSVPLGQGESGNYGETCNCVNFLLSRSSATMQSVNILHGNTDMNQSMCRHTEVNMLLFKHFLNSGIGVALIVK